MRVAIVTQDVIGDRLAGPAIRSLAIAKALAAADHDVRVHSTGAASSPSELVAQGRLTAGGARSIARWADIVLVQGDVLDTRPDLGRGSGVLVCDLYDPFQMEGLVRGVALPSRARFSATRRALSVLSGQIERGDLFLCASDRQRLFWMGHLDAAGRVNPVTYDADPSLGNLIRIVPFGIEEAAPVRDGTGLRGRVEGLDDSSRILLWGGGIYDWLDPLPLVSAVAAILDDVPEVRLVFMGTAHPNPAVSASEMLGRTRSLAASLGVEHAVLFHDGWVPYDQRHNVLLDAEIGVSGHVLHVETTLAFRTRILDYIWAGLPVLTTSGDALGDLVASHGLGAVVPPRDPVAVADGLRTLLLDAEATEAARRAVRDVAPSMRWSSVLRPLLDYCADPQPAADRQDVNAVRLRGGRAPRGSERRARMQDLAGAARATFEVGGPRAVAAKVRRKLDRGRA